MSNRRRFRPGRRRPASSPPTARRWALLDRRRQLDHPLNPARPSSSAYSSALRPAYQDGSARSSGSGVPMTIEVSPYRVWSGSTGISRRVRRGYVLRLSPAPSLAMDRTGRVKEVLPGARHARRVAPRLPWIECCAGDRELLASPRRLPVVARAAEDLHLVAGIVNARIRASRRAQALHAGRDELGRSRAATTSNSPAWPAPAARPREQGPAIQLERCRRGGYTRWLRSSTPRRRRTSRKNARWIGPGCGLDFGVAGASKMAGFAPEPRRASAYRRGPHRRHADPAGADRVDRVAAEPAKSVSR